MIFLQGLSVDTQMVYNHKILQVFRVICQVINQILQLQFPYHTETTLPSQHPSYVPNQQPSYIPSTSPSGWSSLFPSESSIILLLKPQASTKEQCYNLNHL